jgi:hypothetical protein
MATGDQRQWMLIETAPKDMGPVLVLVRGSRIGYWQEEPDTIHVAYLKRPNTYVLQDEDHFIVEPTHWMELPEIPPLPNEAGRHILGAMVTAPQVVTSLRHREAIDQLTYCNGP